ncbi:hypothetical protein [Streptomyces sp. MA15]|uniref:hypothetical protein n=1 Tax=Streptomyces sp. MA15 TaxID=3055061 RepID=UPI0025AF4A4D|nr:hypothetical protein [Streptomyces sp. MA15]MDN3271227.1 hypothetical protein [Streptomyces sp. MA15]
MGGVAALGGFPRGGRRRQGAAGQAELVGGHGVGDGGVAQAPALFGLVGQVGPQGVGAQLQGAGGAGDGRRGVAQPHQETVRGLLVCLLLFCLWPACLVVGQFLSQAGQFQLLPDLGQRGLGRGPGLLQQPGGLPGRAGIGQVQTAVLRAGAVGLGVVNAPLKRVRLRGHRGDLAVQVLHGLGGLPQHLLPLLAVGRIAPCVEVGESREAQVGRFRVRRALPRRGRRTVGAWCFADHMGPADATEDSGLDIGPHPHIGLQTVT